MARDGAWPTFYASPLGGAVRVAVERRLESAWGDVGALSVLGLGSATAFHPRWARARRAIDAGREPGPGGVRVREESLPFGDAAFDRVLVIHALETCADPAHAMREAARVLAASGRILVVCVARSGLWAGARATPLARGRSFGGGDLIRLVKAAGLEPTARRRLLHTPPLGRLARHAGVLERCGGWLWPALGGLVVVEATRRDFVRPSLRRAAYARGSRRQLRPARAPALRVC